MLAYAEPEASTRPACGELLAWQPALAHLAVKIGCTSAANDTLAGLQTQAPPEQSVPIPHTKPQPPQLLGSDWVSSQTPEQSISPLGHVQLLLWHVLPPMHTLPQLPQLFGSVLVVLHTPAQFV